MPRTKRESDASEPWRIEFFQRHDDREPRSVPARDFLSSCPPGVRADFLAIVKAVAEAPPPRFGGGGKWEAMHGEMRGFYEVRVTGPDRRQYRLFCLLERAAPGLAGPSVVLITGMEKPFRSTFSPHDYRAVRRLGEEFRARDPRSVLG